MRMKLSTFFPIFSAIRLVAACGVLFLVSCDLFTYRRPFGPEYYTSNFIAATGFDVTADLTLLPTATDPATGLFVPATGVWDFAYRYAGWDSNGDTVGDGDYLSLEPMSSDATNPAWATPAGSGFSGSGIVVPDGLDPAASVYRLELANFLTGQDFEGISDSAGLAALGWQKDASAGAGASTLFLQEPGFHGKSLGFSLSSTLHSVTYTIQDPLVEGAKYVLSFSWKGDNPTGANLVVTVNDVVEEKQIPYTEGSGTVSIEFTAAAANTVTFTASSPLDIAIDDLTVRAGLATPLRLRLLLKQAETAPVLEPLLYRFTFWVCEDPTVGSAGAPYPLDTFWAQMLGTEWSTLSTVAVPDRYVHDGAAAPSWKKMTVQVENGNLVMQDASGAHPVLELALNLDAASPGRILIAQGKLRAYPDGY